MLFVYDYVFHLFSFFKGANLQRRRLKMLDTWKAFCISLFRNLDMTQMFVSNVGSKSSRGLARSDWDAKELVNLVILPESVSLSACLSSCLTFFLWVCSLSA